MLKFFVLSLVWRVGSAWWVDRSGRNCTFRLLEAVEPLDASLDISCSFPFVFNNQTFNECAGSEDRPHMFEAFGGDHSSLWCAVSEEISATSSRTWLMWGFCDCVQLDNSVLTSTPTASGTLPESPTLTHVPTSSITPSSAPTTFPSIRTPAPTTVFTPTSAPSTSTIITPAPTSAFTTTSAPTSAFTTTSAPTSAFTTTSAPTSTTLAPTTFPMTTTPAPTTSITSVPTTSITSVPTMSITGVPTTSITSVPTTSITPAPTTSTTPAPTSSITSVPTTSITTVPTTSITSVPTTSITGVPTTSITSVPTTSITTGVPTTFTPATNEPTSLPVTTTSAPTTNGPASMTPTNAPVSTTSIPATNSPTSMPSSTPSTFGQTTAPQTSSTMSPTEPEKTASPTTTTQTRSPTTNVETRAPSTFPIPPTQAPTGTIIPPTGGGTFTFAPSQSTSLSPTSSPSTVDGSASSSPTVNQAGSIISTAVPTTESRAGNGASTGALLAGTVGGILCIVLGGVFCVRRRTKKSQWNPDPAIVPGRKDVLLQNYLQKDASVVTKVKHRKRNEYEEIHVSGDSPVEDSAVFRERKAVLHEGFLSVFGVEMEDQAHGRETWKRVYLVLLHNGVLVCYSNMALSRERTKSYIGELWRIRPESIVTIESQIDEGRRSKKHRFAARTAWKDKIFFETETASEKNLWMKTLESVVGNQGKSKEKRKRSMR